jgi:hypothetical protein
MSGNNGWFAAAGNWLLSWTPWRRPSEEDPAMAQAIEHSLDPAFNVPVPPRVDPAEFRYHPLPPPISPDELSAKIQSELSNPQVLRSILATLPGVDPNDPRFAGFYDKPESFRPGASGNLSP